MNVYTCEDIHLAAVLDSTTSDAIGDADAKVLRHLETCRRCQRKLETMAADDQWWDEAKEQLSSASASPQPPRLAETETHATSVHAEMPSPQNSKQLELDFLAEPSHPEMLGRIGKYDVEYVIGAGGMGIVLKGFDSELNRPIAVKVLAPQLATSGAARQRFAREAQAAAAVVHEHVIAIHAVDTDNKFPFIVMPFVDGESLQARVNRDGPLTTKEVVRIAMQIAGGLAAAHRQGLVHRDVKPANILLDRAGRVYITDFGLARAADDASLTRTGMIAGTPSYMSPEQVQGGTVDYRSDLFSLGSLMYFACTGRPPFRANGAWAVLHRICHHSQRAVRASNAEIPRWLGDIVDRLLHKRPDLRFSDAAELRDLLAAHLAHMQQPETVPKPKRIRSSKMSRQAACVGIVICALLAASLPKTLSLVGVGASPDSNSTQMNTNSDSGQDHTPPGATGVNDIESSVRLMPGQQLDREIGELATQTDSIEGMFRGSGESTVRESVRWHHRLSDLDRLIRQLEESR